MLRAFAAVPDSRLRSEVAGLPTDELQEEVEALIATDSRVMFSGWLAPDKLEDLLCAADVYVQPGSQSSTMQTSLCCRCAVLLEDWENHRIYMCDNGWLVRDEDDIHRALLDISEASGNLPGMQRRSGEYARKTLDYAVLAKRVLS